MSTHNLTVIAALVLAVALAVSQFANAQSDIFQPAQKRIPSGMGKFCGKHLADALQLLCGGVYNPLFKKRGQAMDEIDDDYPYAYDESYPFRSRASANAMMGRFGGGRFRRQLESHRGVYDECCAKSCTYYELSTYCGNHDGTY